jgi:hypothetical protein
MGQKLCKYLVRKYAMTKTLLPIVLGLVVILSPSRADDITLTDGTVLKNAKMSHGGFLHCGAPRKLKLLQKRNLNFLGR